MKSPYKILKPVDFMVFGGYICFGFILFFSGQSQIAIMFMFMGLHYFPLVYLLRKHGYWGGDDLGINTTAKGEQLFEAIYISPFKKTYEWVRNTRFYPILRLFLRLFLFLLVTTPIVLIALNLLA